jgi:hypothetical protein
MNQSTLRAALLHLEKMLKAAKKNNRTADALVLEVAIDSINYRIEKEAEAAQRAKIDKEIDRIVGRIMSNAGLNPYNYR